MNIILVGCVLASLALGTESSMIPRRRPKIRTRIALNPLPPVDTTKFPRNVNLDAEMINHPKVATMPPHPVRVTTTSVTLHPDAEIIKHHDLEKMLRPGVEIMKHPRHGEIVGGKDADLKKRPYQLQLAVNGDQACGASVIGKEWALTAAHCVYEAVPEAITVRAGATRRNTGGRVHSVAKIIIHHRYSEDDEDFDIALLKVRKPFQFGSKVQKILLPNQNERVSEGDIAVVSGWGYLTPDGYDSSNTLQYVKLPIVNQKKCEKIYKKESMLITDRMMCAGLNKGLKDSCQGDSGGPMVVGGKLMGVVSWGVGCAVKGYPGVYTRVSRLRHWIKEHSGV